MIKTAKAHNHMPTALETLRRENLSSLALLQLHACSLNHELKIFSLILLFLEKSSANQFQCSTTISKKKKKQQCFLHLPHLQPLQFSISLKTDVSLPTF